MDSREARGPHSWHVAAGPCSGTGHDFSFAIAHPTGEISDLVIGEIEPPTAWDD